jgi:polyisoprenyl-phosphate glycosyltransferase
VEGTASDTVELSVVVPVYGCGGCLRALHHRLRASVAQITPRFELIFVDDRSPDDAWDTLLELAQGDPAVRGFRLSRNFGQDAAITAGLSCARGRWVVVIDCDLQEAPEEIPRLYETAREGFEIVQTVRRHRRQSRPRHIASRLYRRAVIGDGAANGLSTLSIISRRVAEAFLSLGDRDREYRLALRWLGFTCTAIEIDFHDREDGKTSYTLRRLVSLGLSGIFFRTTTLLTWIVVAGFAIAIAGAGLAAYDVYDHFAARPSVPGYTSVVVIMLVLVGFLIITVGVVGMYVGRIFEQVKGRPLFIIDARTSDAAFAPELAAIESPQPERTVE